MSWRCWMYCAIVTFGYMIYLGGGCALCAGCWRYIRMLPVPDLLPVMNGSFSSCSTHSWLTLMACGRITRATWLLMRCCRMSSTIVSTKSGASEIKMPKKKLL